MSFCQFIRNLLQDEQAATAVEYGLILAMVVLAMLAALQSVATEIISVWNHVEVRVTTSS